MPKSTLVNHSKFPVRKLTVRGGHYDYQYRKHPTPPEVPRLELRGYWLRQAGFEVGSRVRVVVRNGYLLLVDGGHS